MRFVAAILLLAMLPGVGQAQTAVRAAQPVIDSAAPNLTGQAFPGSSMPLWGTPDGRILAMVAFGAPSHGAPALPQSPQFGSAADWQLIDITNFVTGGLSLRFGNNITTYANLSRGIVLEPLNPAALSVGCNAWQQWSAGAPCANSQRQALAENGALRVGTQLSSGDFDLDLNYGLSWLRYTNQPDLDTRLPATPNLFAGIGNESLPTLIVPGMQFAGMRNAGLGALGHWRLDDDQSFDLGATLSRIRFELPGSALSPILDQAALSFGVHHGDFSGVIVGRVLGSGDLLSNGQHWSSVDLGVSWRAPWRGIFSIGAQNLWSSGSPPLLANPATPVADPNQARVPYVQYHQDL
ncbi:MAG: hypothetical protein ABI304_12975 [Rudaea sp.]